MTRGLISDQQMAAIREMAEIGMVTSVDIFRRDAVVPASSDDYGDNVEFNETTGSRRTTIQGWLQTVPMTQAMVDAGAVITDQLWELRLPYGTEVAVGDEVHSGGRVYHVLSVDSGKTLSPYIKCNLRRREG